MSDDRNEVRRAHARITDLETELETLRSRPLSPAQVDRLIIFFNTWIAAKVNPTDVSYLEAKTVRTELLEAFGITEDQMDEARDDSEQPPPL